jgi:hypothetical protein
MNELNMLIEGKEKPVVYFTQGNGELDLENTNPNAPVGEGLGLLKRRLEESNYRVKGLQFSPAAGIQSDKPDLIISEKVPDSGENAASLVVIAGPKKPLQDFALKALRDYMEPIGPDKKKGKLIVLGNVAVSPEKSPVATGLESWLAEYSVQLGGNRVLHLPTTSIPDPSLVQVATNWSDRREGVNPIAEAFRGVGFLFMSPRTVDPVATPPGQSGPRFSAETLFWALAQQYIWAETDFKESPSDLAQDILKREDKKRLSTKNLSVGVTVSENVGGAGAGPHAFMNMEKRPRLVVIGDSIVASNRLVSARPEYFSLMSSIIAWLREKPANIGIEPKKSDSYTVDPTVNRDRMVGIPLLLLLVGIVGLGTGVWIVRRR